MRGSGQIKGESAEYKALTDSLYEKFMEMGQSYQIVDLEYPAQNISLRTCLGAFVSAGRSYSYGKSVSTGVENLKKYYSDRIKICPKTKVIFIGYSQGAQVVGVALSVIDPENVIYVALFGDPLLYLPESQNSFACRGEGLSEYRIDVPDCRVESGILGARIPYVPDGFKGKVGTWCNEGDIICGSGHD